MSRVPLHCAVLSSAALRRCALAVFFAAVVADATTLSQRHLRFRASSVHQAAAAVEEAANPCAAWVQEHAGHQLVAGQAPPPCPCLNTPPPLMTPAEVQATEVKGAADNAMLKGLTRIQEAALEAAEPFKKGFEELKAETVEKEAQDQLDAAEKNQTAFLKVKLETEEARQEQELTHMEAGASAVAKMTSEHVQETTEQWAENQARNYIVLSANGTLADAIEKSQKTVAIRQEAAELTKSAIRSASQALEVAKKAQAAIDMVPKDAFVKAQINAAKSTKEQQALNQEIEATEASVRSIANVAKEAQEIAIATLNEANLAEHTAKEALETSRSNALKIEKLKDRSQAVFNRAKKAEESFEKNQAA